MCTLRHACMSLFQIIPEECGEFEIGYSVPWFFRGVARHCRGGQRLRGGRDCARSGVGRERGMGERGAEDQDEKEKEDGGETGRTNHGEGRWGARMAGTAAARGGEQYSRTLA